MCRLLRPLYGTKQGANKWYQELKKFFLEIGFTVSISNEAVFYQIISADRFIIVGVATDDFTIVASSQSVANAFKTKLNNRFKIVDLGAINWLLSMSIVRDYTNRTISLGQEAFIEKVATRFDVHSMRPVSTPLEPAVDLSPDAPHVSAKFLSPSEKSRYREIIGSIMYPANMTRPDIMFSISTLSQHLEAPRTTHLKAANRVLSYLYATKNHRLVIGGKEPSVVGYSDSDWAS